jgi:hypothetical protein
LDVDFCNASNSWILTIIHTFAEEQEEFTSFFDFFDSNLLDLLCRFEAH